MSAESAGLDEAAAAPEAPTDAVRRDLSMGQFFRAFDRARAALEAGGEDATLRLMAAAALVQTGAVAEARETVAGFDRLLDELDLERPGEPGTAAVALLDNPEDADLLGRIYRASWRELGYHDDLRRARDLELARFSRHRGVVEGATAAVLSRFLGETERAQELALACLAAGPGVEAAGEEDPDGAAFAHAMAAAEAALLLGRSSEADKQLALAGRLAVRQPTRGVEARHHLRDLAGLGVAIPQRLWAHFKPPEVVIFAGAPADRPGQGEAVLPPQVEAPLAAALDALLEELDAAIGYCSLAAGADLMFVEAMLRRGAEVNAVLPFEEADFLAHRVRPCGSRWVERYEAARRSVASATPVCRDLYLGNDVLLRFANQVIDGRARLRAAALDTTPTLVAVWDYMAEPLPGSPSDFIDHWGDPARLRILDLADLRESVPADAPLPEDASDEGAETPPVRPNAGPIQAVRAMLFADVVGYSTIQDHHLPAFWTFLQAVRDRLGARLEPAVHVGSWGDALFIVTERAVELAEIAVGLTEACEAVDTRALGLPVRLRLRIGLHAGPVFTGDHPLSGESVLYGGNVNRAARIEPITVPGRIYASEQFVALLTSEHSAAAVEARMTGAPPPAAWSCRYRGELSLAKNYGRQAVYEIAPPEARP